MRRWVSSPSYKRAIAALVDARHASGQTQRDVAAAIGKPPSFVAKIETGERRLDFVEFIAVARALGVDPSQLMATVAEQIGAAIEI